MLKKEGVDIQLSRLWAYAKVRDYEGTPFAEDSGAQIRDVVKMLAEMGCPLESQYPYDVNNVAVEPDPSLDAEAVKHKILFYYRCPNLAALKASLAQGFAVIFGFSVPENMMSPECEATGLVLKPARGESFVGGHAVLAMGHDDHKVVGDQIGAVLCLNSWSAQWGEGGYCWLPYWYFTSGQADDLWTVRRVLG